MISIDFNTVPITTGIYIFNNNKQKPIYIGKAVNLRSRVKSYFLTDIEDKTRRMLVEAESFSFIKTLSEVEALILESKLIKTFKPKYNKLQKDDKTYQYIRIEKAILRSKKSSNEPEIFSRVLRVHDTNNKDIFFGPYPQGNTVWQIYKSLRKVFGFRDCSTTKFNRHKRLGRGCLYYDLGLCPAPCAEKIGIREYAHNIKNLVKFLDGKSLGIEEEWRTRIEMYSKKHQYERASEIKRKLEALNYIRDRSIKPEEYIKNPNLYEEIRSKEFDSLAEILLSHVCENRAASTPLRTTNLPVTMEYSNFVVEAYDISNIQGTNAVGSKVAFLKGEPIKHEYRRYRIKTVKGISDVAMMQEILRRRLTNKGDLPLPSLILIDGGKPQVGKAMQVLEQLKIDIPLLGLAKRKEVIIYKQGNEYKELKLKKDNSALKLLQRIRDEAHRFGINYHRKLRTM